MKDCKHFSSFFNHLLPILDAESSDIKRLQSIMKSADPETDQAFIDILKDGIELLKKALHIRKFARAELSRDKASEPRFQKMTTFKRKKAIKINILTLDSIELIEHGLEKIDFSSLVNESDQETDYSSACSPK
jgi:hypothetical protein